MINISQATLDVIKAIQTNKTVKFKYGSYEGWRELEPDKFFGDFEGIGGHVNVDEEDKDNYRKFYFHRMTEWRGIEPLYKVNFELDFQGYPSDKEILERLHELLDNCEPFDYTIILEEER
jgi:hypothetical protein